jgi:hypothetical protein
MKVICMVYSFDFDKDHFVVIFCHDIEFTTTDGVVCLENFVAGICVVVSYELFGGFSLLFEVIGHGQFLMINHPCSI